METKQVKTIRIFLASSNELKADRDQFAAFITRLNGHYEPRGFEFVLEVWEFTDPAYNNKRKQDEYNALIRQSDYFVALFYTKAGKYTVEELKVARKECESRQMPLFIYFRDLSFWQVLRQKDKNLEEIKQYIGDDMKHFWGSYNNNDKLHLDFVLWLDSKLNQNSSIRVEGDDVKIGDLSVAQFSQLPFAANNAEYLRLEQQLTALEKDIEELRQDVAEYPENKKFSERLSQKVLAREALQQEFQRQQDALLGAAKRIAELRKQQVSEKLEQAIELFDSGDMRGANALLREIEKESVSIDESFEKDRQRIHQLIDAALIQTSTEMSITETPIEKRINIIAGIFAKADDRAQRSAYPEEKYAKLLFDYAWFLNKYAHYPEAVEVYLRQISLSEKLYCADHPDTARSYNNIGLVYQNQGDYDQALDYCTKALVIRENVLGEDHPYTASSYNNIAEVYRVQSNYDKSLNYYNKALVVMKKVLGEEHPYTATSYNNIGLVYQAKGAYAQALDYFDKALKIVKKVLGEDHPYTAASYNNIGAVYYIQGAYAQTLDYYNKALDIREKILGKDHPDTAQSYNNLGAVYNDQGKYDPALNYYNKALEIYEKVLGKDHPNTATSYNNIGGVYHNQGAYAQALEYYNKALAIREKVLGKDHPNTATSYNNIGWVYRAQGDFKHALEYFEKAFAILQQKLGDDHPYTRSAKRSIEFVKGKLGEE